MKIINNRVVCSGCEEPFEVGQMVLFVQPLTPIRVYGFVITDGIQVPTTSWLKENMFETANIFHEGCD